MGNKLNNKLSEVASKYLVNNGKKFRLKDVDPGDTGGFDSEFKDESAEILSQGVAKLAEYQDRLYAQNNWGVLLIFQAMDAAGKDSTIKHVMSGINPQGCQVYSFKVPSSEELNHDFLWRTTKSLPERGRIGIFNRSYYEEVLVVRVHPEFLQSQRIPSSLITKKIWKQRYESINTFEKHLSRNGFVIRKFFLNVSRKEQKKRFLSRLDEPDKNWKFALGDVHEREHWDDYMNAYENLIRYTSKSYAPWYVVPADNKWYTRLVVAAVVADTLKSLDVDYPKIDRAKRKELDTARVALQSE
jgi:PPK2 family polyphosphate:nucleotide phosphotransferase